MNTELDLPGGDGDLATGGSGALQAGDVRVGDIRRYSNDVAAGAAGLVAMLDGLGPQGQGIVGEYEHLQAQLGAIADQLAANAQAIATDDAGYDDAEIAEAARQAELTRQAAAVAGQAAEDLTEHLHAVRARLRELAGQLGGAAAATVEAVEENHGALERAVADSRVRLRRIEAYENR